MFIDYPNVDDEKAILQLTRQEARDDLREPVAMESPISQADLFAARKDVLDIYMADNLEEYLIQLVLSTRNPAPYGKELGDWLQYGASPRATMALDRCARAHAWLDGRDFVTPEDIQSMAHDVLRHRIILSFEAEAEGITKDKFIDELIARVAVP